MKKNKDKIRERILSFVLPELQLQSAWIISRWKLWIRPGWVTGAKRGGRGGGKRWWRSPSNWRSFSLNSLTALANRPQSTGRIWGDSSRAVCSALTQWWESNKSGREGGDREREREREKIQLQWYFQRCGLSSSYSVQQTFLIKTERRRVLHFTVECLCPGSLSAVPFYSLTPQSLLRSHLASLSNTSTEEPTPEEPTPKKPLETLKKKYRRCFSHRVHLISSPSVTGGVVQN